MKKNLIKLLKGGTLALPILIYIWLSATLFNVNPKHTMELPKNNIHETYVEDDFRMFIYTSNASAKYNGVVEFNTRVMQYGIYVRDGDTIKINKDFYGVGVNEDTNKLELVEFSAFKIGRKETIGFPMATIITIIAILIVVLVVKTKMQWAKKYRKLATWIALAFGTGILFVMNMIVSNIFYVFLIALISWTAYCFESLIFDGFDADKELDKTKELLDSLIRR